MIYLKMYIFMIQKHMLINKINLKFMLAVMVHYNNLLEILKEIKMLLIKLNILKVKIV